MFKILKPIILLAIYNLIALNQCLPVCAKNNSDSSQSLEKPQPSTSINADNSDLTKTNINSGLTLEKPELASPAVNDKAQNTDTGANTNNAASSNSASTNADSGLEPASSGNSSNEDNVNYNAIKTKDINKAQVDKYLKKGQLLFSQGKYKKAITFYRKVLLVDPQNSNAYYNLAVIDEDTDKLKDALVNYQNALKFSPNDMSIVTAIADVKNKMHHDNFNPSKNANKAQPVISTNSFDNSPVYPVYTNQNKHPVVKVIGRDIGKVLRFGLYTAGAVAGGMVAGYDPCGCFW